ncbi:hypothetical protein KR222_001464 [Zaprionus bogoriensis]|nr:hypothetical protein KR222_001464 [Zaprionus bogoriensis]
MASGDFQSYLRLLCGFFGEFQSVLRQQTRPPPRIALHHHRAFLVLLCLHPNERLARNSIYKFASLAAMCNISALLFMIVCALPETDNAIDMGDDMVWVIGVGLIFIKMLYSCLRANQIDDVIEDFAYYDRVFRSTSDNTIDLRSELQNEEILRWQRICYLIESSMFISMTILVTLFSLAISVSPLIIGKQFPYHVYIPFWHGSFWSDKMLYLWMALTSQINLLAICNIDLLGVHSFLHTALNLKLLCIELSKLGNVREDHALFHTQFCRIVRFHQHIISTVQKNNRVFHGTFIAQMIASFAMVSMSTFETMATLHDPKEAVKFVIFAVTTFVQLSYWCLAGTLVDSQVERASTIYSLCTFYFDSFLFLVQSTEVAQAAFEINDWHTRPVDMQRNIMFMIKRSQKPLVYAAQPFPPFTLVTYSIILKQCYRALALLRESV